MFAAYGFAGGQLAGSGTIYMVASGEAGCKEIIGIHGTAALCADTNPTRKRGKPLSLACASG
jgi:hypothetical protein